MTPQTVSFTAARVEGFQCREGKVQDSVWIKFLNALFASIAAMVGVTGAVGPLAPLFVEFPPPPP